MDVVLDTEEAAAEAGQPVLTRPEYLKLLATCRAQDNRRFYLVIKLIGGAGLRSQEVLDLTVEAVRQGVVGAGQGSQQPVRLPRLIQRELLEYAAENQIKSGLMFTARRGKPLNYDWVRHNITLVAMEAGVDRFAATPRGLRKMYLATQKRIYDCLQKLAAQNYDWLLEQEQNAAGRDM